jgi:selenocysteine-specific elongation factor
VQVHDESVDRAAAGQRVAVNLTGVAVSDVRRGDVLASPELELRPAYRIEAALEFGFSEPEPGDRVQVHHGTREAPARLRRLGDHRWQLRLERPLVAAPGDRLVIRQIAPPDTLGGGVVRAGETAYARDSRKQVPRRHRSPAPPLTESALKLEHRLRQAGLEPPLDSELDAGELAALREHGRAIRVGKNLHYHPEALSEARDHVLAIARRNEGAVTLSQLRDELGTSRKFAQALLEHFDNEKLTIRRGDAHYLRRGAA